MFSHNMSSFDFGDAAGFSSAADWLGECSSAGKPDVQSSAKELEQRIPARLRTELMEYVTGKSSPRHYSVLLAQLATQKKWWLVEPVLDWMRINGPFPSLYHYNAALNVFAKCCLSKKAEALIKRMFDNQHCPNERSYNCVIHACAMKGDSARAEYWLKEMGKRGVDPSVVTYNSLIGAYVHSGDLCESERCLQRMADAGIDPDLYTFNSIINSCLLSRQPERAGHWLTKMISMGVAPTVYTYNTMLHACASQERPDLSEHWFSKMLAEGPPPNIISFNIIINSCATPNPGNIEKAQVLVKQMMSRGLKADAFTLTSMIKVCLIGADLERAALWLERILNGQCPLDAEAFRILTKICNTPCGALKSRLAEYEASRAAVIQAPMPGQPQRMGQESSRRSSGVGPGHAGEHGNLCAPGARSPGTSFPTRKGHSKVGFACATLLVALLIAAWALGEENLIGAGMFVCALSVLFWQLGEVSGFSSSKLMREGFAWQ